MEEILKVDGLSKTFTLSRKQQKIERTTVKRKVAVDDLSFSAYSGEIFGLLGPNGAGKTTTLRMLSTLIRPDSGDATLDGYSVVHQPAEVRAKIGFLTSELKLEDFFTPSASCTVSTPPPPPSAANACSAASASTSSPRSRLPTSAPA